MTCSNHKPRLIGPIQDEKGCEYDQAIQQSHSADQFKAPQGRATENAQSQDIRKTIKVQQLAISSSSSEYKTINDVLVLSTVKTRTKRSDPQSLGAIINN